MMNTPIILISNLTEEQIQAIQKEYKDNVAKAFKDDIMSNGSQGIAVNPFYHGRCDELKTIFGEELFNNLK